MPKFHTRPETTKAVWYYQLAGEEWKAFPETPRHTLENQFTRDPKYKGAVQRYCVEFPPFLPKSNKSIGENILVDFVNLTLSTKNPDFDMKIKRNEEFEVSPARAQFDKKCGVETFPLFANPFYIGDYEIGEPAFTIYEQNIMKISAAIREKPDWETKFCNPDIVQKWRSELLEQGETEEIIQYVFDELNYYKSLQVGSIKPSGVQGVWQADGLVPEELRQALLQEVSKLENVPEKDKDWHPGSDKQVLDLVHPSLFCLVAGVSLESSPGHPPFKYIGGGKPVSDDFLASSKFKQLEQEISEMTSRLKEETKDTSYYNEVLKLAGEPVVDDVTDTTDVNGNPEKKIRTDLATKIAELKTKMTELTRGKRNNIDAVFKSKKYQWLPSDVQIDDKGNASILSYINNLDPRTNEPLYKVLTKILSSFIPMYDKVLSDLYNPRERRYQPDPYEWYTEPEDMDDEAYDEYYENRRPVLPPLPSFSPPPIPDKTFTLNGRRLQVIVKLANIILTPENPEYKGGSWHVEGMKNEQIVSSGIYYYHSENISESRLHFRLGICEPSYEQNDNTGMEVVYGLFNEGPLNQKLGSVITQSGRSIAFPNLYQHWVAPFKLQDPSKNGIRKILVYFLVDPGVYIPSTFSVPPQQPSWRKETLAKVRPFSTLPSHILDYICEQAAIMTLEDAKKYREELMEERKILVKKNTEQVFEREFSLCEH